MVVNLIKLCNKKINILYVYMYDNEFTKNVQTYNTSPSALHNNYNMIIQLDVWPDKIKIRIIRLTTVVPR